MPTTWQNGDQAEYKKYANDFEYAVQVDLDDHDHDDDPEWLLRLLLVFY